MPTPLCPGPRPGPGQSGARLGSAQGSEALVSAPKRVRNPGTPPQGRRAPDARPSEPPISQGGPWLAPPSAGFQLHSPSEAARPRAWLRSRTWPEAPGERRLRRIGRETRPLGPVLGRGYPPREPLAVNQSFSLPSAPVVCFQPIIVCSFILSLSKHGAWRGWWGGVGWVEVFPVSL